MYEFGPISKKVTIGGFTMVYYDRNSSTKNSFHNLKGVHDLEVSTQRVNPYQLLVADLATTKCKNTKKRND